MTTSAVSPPAHPAPAEISSQALTAHPRRWAALFVILAAEVMDMLDGLVTSIAGPSIRTDLGGSESMIQWLGAGYTLAMAVGLITGGRLGDIYGRRRMFVMGAAGFAISSVLCAFSQDPAMLIAFRVTQGLLGSLMLPQGLGMIKEMFPPAEAAVAFGAFGPVIAASAVGGPVLAGWLVSADYFGFGWRMIFLINLPLGLAAVLGGLRVLPRTPGAHASRLDLRGVAIISAASFLMVYPLVEGRDLGWPAWAFAMIAASAVLLAAFGAHIVRVSRRGGDPLVTPSLFTRRAFSAGLVSGTAFFAALTGLALVTSLYMQIGLGDSALTAGLAVVPMSAGMIVGFGIAAPLTPKLGRRLLHVGLVVIAAGAAYLAVVLHNAGAAGLDVWHMVGPLAVTGIGTGLLMAPFFDLILAGVEPHETGSASGTLNAVQQFGGSLGVAILGTVFFHILRIGPAGPDPASVEHGMQAILWIIIGLVALTFAAAFLLPRRARDDQAEA